jgi:AmiR/NasT family two-component response regulator
MLKEKPCVFCVETDTLHRVQLDIILRKEMRLMNVVIIGQSEKFTDWIDEFPFVPDLILLDIKAAPIDAMTMHYILKLHPVFHSCNIVAMLENKSVPSVTLDELRQSGFEAALYKPLDGKTFPAIVDKILQHKFDW